MQAYSKLLVALIGAVLIALDQFFNISVAYDAEAVMNVLIPFLTAAGVWAVPNATA
jgi:hypothetical protein